MEITDILRSQYLASFGMIREVLVKCPAPVWDEPGDKEPTWKKAYHALHIAHMYLQPRLEDFVPWVKHRDGDPEPLAATELLEYLEIVTTEMESQLARMDLAAPSGFQWLPINKLELQVYNIRHIQQHAGELYERLDRHNIELNWVGLPPAQK